MSCEASWTVLCAGRSLAAATPSAISSSGSGFNFHPNRCVAVNRAIYRQDFAPRYWLTLDDPTRSIEAEVSVVSGATSPPWIAPAPLAVGLNWPRRAPIALCRTSREYQWRAAFPELAREPHPDGEAFAARLGWADVRGWSDSRGDRVAGSSEASAAPYLLCWLKYSVLAAIVECAVRGATDVLVVGADMDGAGYATSPSGVSAPDETPTVWGERWDDERAMFARAVSYAAERAVRVERWTPRPAELRTTSA